jgi:phosphatidylinositol alpha-1,6-mannosyltransferase
MLGIFPSLNPAVFGGVEESGRVAWNAIATSSDRVGEPRLLCYSPSGAGTVSNNQGAFYARTKPGAIFAALATRWSTGAVLIWHIGLLHLLPFLRIGEAKVVLFLHGIEAWRRQDRLIRFLLRRVDLFLTNSQYTWNRFIAVNTEFSDSPHKIVHLGLGTPIAETAAETPDVRPAALMLGRMVKEEDYKGHREMIKAWRFVVDFIPDAELWIAGTGNLQHELERTAHASTVADQIHFFGKISQEKKEELLRQSRCLVLPSRGEGFGLVYLEAMRFGRPCLVSSLDAGQEVVNPPGAGLAVHPDNTHEIAEATWRLLTRGVDWDGFSQRARRRYEDQFTAAHFEHRLLRALVELDG